LTTGSRTLLQQVAPRGKPLQLSRERQFWIFQLGGWSTWVLLLVIRDLTFVPAEYMLQRVAMFVMDAAIGMLLTTGLRYLYRSVWESPLAVRMGVVIGGSLLASLVWQPFQNLMEIFSFGDTVELAGTGWLSLFRGLLPFSFPLLLLWSGLYFFIKYYQLFQAEKEKSLRSEALAHEAQLRMLRYQLNPHFLFNTLNAISTLVLEKATGPANEMLIKLSKFLRYTLDHSPLDQVSLAHEIETSKLYLEIEKVRFGERMRLDIDIAEPAQKALVPSMLLQPLIENSIKHAISKRESGGGIRIAALVRANKLVLEVSDDGPGFNPDAPGGDPSSTSGVGLNNIRNRLKEIYGSNHQILFSNAIPTGCKVTVIIPYETE
jgi:signal transduction histidine kinase